MAFISSDRVVRSCRRACMLVSLALCQAASGESAETQQTLAAFETFSTLSTDLRVQAGKVGFINAGRQGAKIAPGFRIIIERVGEATAMLSSNPTTLSDADAKTVVGVLTTFVRIEQELLKVVIYDRHFPLMFPNVIPIHDALVKLEAAVGSFASYLIAAIPTEEPAAQNQFGSLSVTLRLAIGYYSVVR